MHWPKLNSEQISTRVFKALKRNVNYHSEAILGIPASYLDADMFCKDAPFLNEAPFLSTLVANPNHIGCHTLNETERLFSGTQELEKEVIALCSEQIFKGEAGQQDGYIASGGTEANIEALWIYRNYFMQKHGAGINQLAVVFSEDSHYSLFKGSNLLALTPIVIPVEEHNRQIRISELEQRLRQAHEAGIKHFIVSLNLATTLFGSVDDIDAITTLLHTHMYSFRLHVDAAFGGFIYPFTKPENSFHFRNPDVSSITIDAHKMLQTPYGTGIFLIRKGLMDYVKTAQAQYVPGTDHTLCGSRSGANAVSIWMVLANYGSAGWKKKVEKLSDLTNDMCKRFDELEIPYFRNPFINIISIPAAHIPEQLATDYYLVADSYEREVKWWKIVVMPHLTPDVYEPFFEALGNIRQGSAETILNP